eukprot:GHVL01017287.1.p1 GENE.GHVL01017287.1~~GHVL01017287.1.p1  ORF type:complete len:221 (-),score=23.20 GHVL01017287.1:452-1114(-)
MRDHNMQTYSFILILFTIYGAFRIIRYAVYIIWNLFGTFLPLDNSIIEKCGSWAIITGCTDGIGKEYARALVKAGKSVLLISRSSTKLETVKKEFEGIRKDVSIETLVMDFSEHDINQLNIISKSIQGKDIGILVNNVGISYPHAQYYEELDDELIEKLLRVNCSTMSNLIRIVLQQMKKNKSGIIVNISSAEGTLPSAPLYSVYAASKAFVEVLTRSLE